MEIKKNHMYTIKDKYFEDYPDPYLKNNKGENRPCYFAFERDNEKILWMIPLSSKIDKFERLIQKKEEQGKPCDVVHICKIGSRKQAFVIQDMFPITKDYIQDEFTLNGVPYKLADERDIKTVEKKASRIHALHERGIKVLPTQPDVKKIESRLLQNLLDAELRRKEFARKQRSQER